MIPGICIEGSTKIKGSLKRGIQNHLELLKFGDPAHIGSNSETKTVSLFQKFKIMNESMHTKADDVGEGSVRVLEEEYCCCFVG